MSETKSQSRLPCTLDSPAAVANVDPQSLRSMLARRTRSPRRLRQMTICRAPLAFRHRYPWFGRSPLLGTSFRLQGATQLSRQDALPDTPPTRALSCYKRRARTGPAEVRPLSGAQSFNLLPKRTRGRQVSTQAVTPSRIGTWSWRSALERVAVPQGGRSLVRFALSRWLGLSTGAPESDCGAAAVSDTCWILRSQDNPPW